jgi:hypothetical protein
MFINPSACTPLEPAAAAVHPTDLVIVKYVVTGRVVEHTL